MRIIPAIDIIGGRCVRLSKGDYETQKIYHNDPLEVAKEFEANGIRYLHLVDLDGAKAKHIINHEILEKITSKTTLTVDFGGGIKSKEDLERAFGAGAAQVTLGSIAVQNPDFCLSALEKYGADRIVLGADFMHRKIKTAGWLEGSDLDVVDFVAAYQKKGILNVICTDISKDGMLLGPSTSIYKELLSKSPVQLIASGGISGLEDVLKMKEIGCFGTIIGKAIYEGKIKLNELQTI